MSASIINKDSIYTISTQDFLKHQSLVRYLKLKLRIVDTEDQLNYLEIEFIKHKIKKTKPRRNEQIKEFSKYNYKSSQCIKDKDSQFSDDLLRYQTYLYLNFKKKC